MLLLSTCIECVSGSLIDVDVEGPLIKIYLFSSSSRDLLIGALVQILCFLEALKNIANWLRLVSPFDIIHVYGRNGEGTIEKTSFLN